MASVALVVGDVEVEVPVAVDVGEGGGGAAAGLAGQPRGPGSVDKGAGPVAQKERVRVAEGGDQEIEVTIAVHVGEDCAGRVPSGQGQCRCCHLAEPPAAQVQVERVGAFGVAEVEVGKAVFVHVPDGNAGTIRQKLVLEECGIADPVGEADPGAGGGKLGEPGLAASGSRQLTPAIPRFLVPRGLGDRPGAGGSQYDPNEENGSMHRSLQSIRGRIDPRSRNRACRPRASGLTRRRRSAPPTYRRAGSTRRPDWREERDSGPGLPGTWLVPSRRPGPAL